MLDKKNAFTLIEVLISITLLSLVLMALYKSADILRASNKNLFTYLETTTNNLKWAKTLYMDLIKSDGNISIINKNRKFDRVIIYNSKNSIYGLYNAKIEWLVYKDKNQLIRVEGNNYELPLKSEQNIAIDKIATNMELFKIYKNKNKKKDKILLILKNANLNIQSFLIQNLTELKPKIKLVSPGELGHGGDKKKKDRFVPPII